jgi:hypothetical protein
MDNIVAELWGKMEGFTLAMRILDYGDDEWPEFSQIAFEKLVKEFADAENFRKLHTDGYIEQ